MNELSQEFLKQIKKRLTTDLEQLSLRLQQLKVQDPYLDPEHANDNAASDTDASEEGGHDRIQAMVDELTTQIQATEKALANIEAGTYGICEVTGKPIPQERLEVFPTATTIVGV